VLVIQNINGTQLVGVHMWIRGCLALAAVDEIMHGDSWSLT